ncbi:MAG: molybdopterin-dependent oxidoreductase [Alphaproteobacteria bacterium]|nr:molybdopterin-dependent oxidoreductase [Alphaproteobacteria bacterium]
MLTKRTSTSVGGTRLSKLVRDGATAAPVDRRAFLRRSGLAAGGLAAVGAMPLASVERAAAQGAAAKAGEVKLVKNICTHCSVGCSVTAEVVNGVWVGQEPSFESPINLGAHCAKGAAVRELLHGDRRLKYPMKLQDGRWVRLSWDQAVNEVGDRLLKIREQSGPDSVYWLGSAKFTNESAYLNRKFAAFWGTNNVDHQARICHSTTVAGVAQTWGYGAMTNSYNDIQNSRAIFLIGGNPAEAHPVSLLHMLRGKEQNNAPFIVCDPRFTRTAAHSTEHVRLRPGTDIALIWGILWHCVQNGWTDEKYVRERVYGFDDVKKEVAKYTPEEVERITGVPGSQLRRVAQTLWNNRPFTVIWCMGGTQHSVGTANVRAYCILGLNFGIIGTSGGGANIYRGHCNVQGATDMGLDVLNLPAYYGLAEQAWRHWARVWNVPYDYMLGRFKSKQFMEAPGTPQTRWADLVLEDKKNIDQPDNLKAMVFWGHGANTQVRGPDNKKAMQSIDTVVVIDPHPTQVPVMSEGRKDGVYLLPACTAFEMEGSRTASNRSLQWGNKVTDPIFESKNDLEIMYLLARKFGFEKEMFRNIKVEGTKPAAEDVLRELNRGSMTIGYSGQSPERLKRHMANQQHFDKRTLEGTGPMKGETYGLPWPCWGKPEHGHPGTHVLYDTSKEVRNGGGTFRALWGAERNGETLLAEGSFSKNSELKDGYPQFSLGMLKRLGWDADLTEDERKEIQEVGQMVFAGNADAVTWAFDTSGGIIRVAIKHGCMPFGNAKARANVWNFPDGVPTHREPIYSADREMVKKYPTYTDRKLHRVPVLYKTIQDRDVSKQFPIVFTSGRLVEYEGGGDETRSNKWLAELQQVAYVEINPGDAGKLGIKTMDDVWIYGPENNARIKVKALVTERVGRGVAWMPFHFAGHWMGEDKRKTYPQGTDPIVMGEAVNTAMTYGYDPVTQMQETKSTLCRIEKA